MAFPRATYTALTAMPSLLSPLGQHRRDHVARSKGKRKKAAEKKAKPDQTAPAPEAPPTPELAAFVDVGLASISRTLEGMAADDGGELFSTIFVARSGHPSAFHSHFPQMVAVASQHHPSQEPVRLVGFSKACEERLSSCLGIPRASAVGLRAGAPQSKALVDFVRTHVSAVEIAWLQEAQDRHHRDTKIKVIETTVGEKRRKKS